MVNQSAGKSLIFDDKKLAEVLTSSQILSEADLKQAEELANQKKITLYDAIIEKDLISDDNLGKVIADNIGLPFIALSKVSIPAKLLHILPESVAERQQTLVFAEDTD